MMRTARTVAQIAASARQVALHRIPRNAFLVTAMVFGITACSSVNLIPADACDPACPDESACVKSACVPARTRSCENCSLQLAVVDVIRQQRSVQNVRLAVDFAPTAQSTLPTEIYARLVSSHRMRAVSAAAGNAVDAVGGKLHKGALSGVPYKSRSCTEIDVLAVGPESRPLGAGRLFVIDVDIVEPASAVSFFIEDHGRIMTPLAAHFDLANEPLDVPVVASGRHDF